MSAVTTQTKPTPPPHLALRHHYPTHRTSANVTDSHDFIQSTGTSEPQKESPKQKKKTETNMERNGFTFVVCPFGQ